VSNIDTNLNILMRRFVIEIVWSRDFNYHWGIADQVNVYLEDCGFQNCRWQYQCRIRRWKLSAVIHVRDSDLANVSISARQFAVRRMCQFREILLLEIPSVHDRIYNIRVNR
jgi:hypothetical protein